MPDRKLNARERIRRYWPESHTGGTIWIPGNMRADAFPVLKNLGVQFLNLDKEQFPKVTYGYTRITLPSGWAFVHDEEISGVAYLMSPDDIIAVIEEGNDMDDDTA